MPKRSQTEFAEAWRGIGFTQAELAEYLAPHGYTPSSLAHMSRGATEVPDELFELLADILELQDTDQPLPAELPEGPRRRHEVLSYLRNLKREKANG